VQYLDRDLGAARLTAHEYGRVPPPTRRRDAGVAVAQGNADPLGQVASGHGVFGLTIRPGVAGGYCRLSVARYIRLVARLEAVQGDITTQAVDAIVNAANPTLLGGGGVDGAIHRAAGPELRQECRQIGGCPTGEARITRGYRLAAARVIHTVGPVWTGGARGEADLLRRCYANCLRMAARERVRSLAFPSISTGAYGYPMEQAARIAVATVREELQTSGVVQLVRFVCFSAADLAVYRKLLDA
jgi:O-acetyl-ADP-ribose deacetylase (regulator of RNase III)